jgi:hypothetical protein
MRRLAVALSAVALVPAALAASSPYGPPRQVGTITAEPLPEISGMVAATAVRGGWWVHNDSGHTAELFLLSPTGRLLQTVDVRGATNEDWEEISSGPAPGGRRYLYVGDIGDNGRVRHEVVVYRLLEPRRGARSARVTKLPYRYPDGRHNAEALFVDPASGRIYVVTKTEVFRDETAVYRFPLPLRPGRTVTLELVESQFSTLIAPVPFVTGAALSPDGTRLAIRTYAEAWEWRRRPGTPFAALFEAIPRHVDLAREVQGEAVTYTTSGKALVTTSESLPAPLWRLERSG